MRANWILLPLLLWPALSQAQTICAIQGNGTNSPYQGQQVTTDGVVTARFSGSGTINGCFIEKPGCDADPSTSNGIFVYGSNAGNMVPGQRVSVTGTVVEYNGLTEITNASFTVLGSGEVTPTDVALPLDSYDHWERYEGMLLRFPGSLVVVDNSSWSQYGEVYLAPQHTRVPTDHLDPNDVNAVGTSYTGTSNAAAISAAQSAIDRSYVLLDDARTNAWPTPAPWADASGTLRAGSTVVDLVGVLHYSYGQYKVEPTVGVVFQHASRPGVPTVAGTVRAVGYNLHNYFTTLDSWGASNAAELGRQRTKLVAALQAMDPDVMALCEVENTDAAWGDLLAALNAAMGAGTYAALEEDAFGQGTRTVILYKPSVMTPVTPLYALNTSLFQRPHLTQGFRLNASGGRFLFSTVHLRSKLCDGAEGANEDQGDGQGCFNAMRRDQINALVDHWAGLRNATGIEPQLIMGDFNAYGQEDPIDRARAAGLVHQTMEEGYTFGYQGMYGALDHVITTPAMDQAVSGVAVWHINADEPSTLDYRDANVDRYQTGPYRSGDHDPVLVGFNGVELGVGLAEVEERGTGELRVQGRRVSWWITSAANLRSGTIELYDIRGIRCYEVAMANGSAQADLDGVASGVYTWRLAGSAVAGRFVLP